MDLSLLYRSPQAGGLYVRQNQRSSFSSIKDYATLRVNLTVAYSMHDPDSV